MGVKVGINGFGRIGKLVFRAAIDRKVNDIDFVAVNDLTSAKTLAHLLKYDSTFGIFDADISYTDNSITVNGKTIKVLSEKDPANLPWKALGVKIVVESTGRFTDREGASKHITAGAEKVIISAPAKGEDLTVVLGVNEDKYDSAKHNILSNASCTTNCLGPVAKIILDEFGIERGMMTTIHSYTNDQVILDFQHKDLRRARAAGMSMIPTTTGAAKAIGLVLPELKGKLDGLAIRVPTPNVSLVDVVFQVKKETTKEAVNAALKNAAEGKMKNYLEFCELPLVSKDFNGNPKSSIVDGLSTMVIGNMVKILSWYDNEWGYSNRTVDLISYISKK
jgi:glyceraldehyde 3-phosphate dehydrogenase